MQHEQSNITGLRKADRFRSARTPDRLDICAVDSSIMISSPKRKVHVSRQSAMPPCLNTTVSAANLRKLELENNNLELELECGMLMNSYAELIFAEKTLKDTNSSFSKSIINIYEDLKSLRKNYQLIQTRIRDINTLDSLDHYLGTSKSNLGKQKDMIKKFKFEKILFHLDKLLNRFNVFCCENIILPSTTEEVLKLKIILRDCDTLLKQISDPTQSDVLDDVVSDYEEFITVFNEMMNVKKIVEGNINNLQTEVLKMCSHLLAPNDE